MVYVYKYRFMIIYHGCKIKKFHFNGKPLKSLSFYWFKCYACLCKISKGEKKEFAIFNYMFSFWKRIITQILMNQNDMDFI